MVVEEAQEAVLLLKNRQPLLKKKWIAWKLNADYQQALDVQQTRALQYQQAVQTLEKTKQLLGDWLPATAESACFRFRLKAQRIKHSNATVWLTIS